MAVYPSDISQRLAQRVGGEFEAQRVLRIGHRALRPSITLSWLRLRVLTVFLIFENYFGRLLVPKQEGPLYRQLGLCQSGIPGLW